jgi:23S rRNA (cytidine1920-2'-O)/16S rRNA (cytidine1409-2'-O)-methyltransferase
LSPPPDPPADAPRYVTRAGHKLAFALDAFGIDVEDAVVADLGSHAGGFVDCLLQRGARRVFAVDTCYGTLDWGLRNDPRVVVMERRNALHLRLPEPVDGVTVDVGWTPQRRVLPRAVALVRDGGWIVSLVKPQYEARPSERTGGVVDPAKAQPVCERVLAELRALDLFPAGPVESPLRGGGGNREFLICLRTS